MPKICVICGSKFEVVPKLRGQATRKTCSEKCSKELKHINHLKGNWAYRNRNRTRLNIQSKNNRDKNPEPQRKRVRESHRKLRDKIKILLGYKCVSCGFSDPRALEIDHKNNNGNKERKQFSTYGYYKHILSQIESGSKDYQLLCSNCNAIKRYERQVKN